MFCLMHCHLYVSEFPEDRKHASVAELVSLGGMQVRNYVANGNLNHHSPCCRGTDFYPVHKPRDSGDLVDIYCRSEPRKKPEHTRIIRQTNYERSRQSKLKVIRMLFVVVIEFFVCWTPLYVVQTWKSFHPESISETMDRTTLSAIFVLAYCSSCCNPITYCFLNKRFRQSFASALSCCCCLRKPVKLKRIPSLTSTKTRTSMRRLTWIERGMDSSSTT